MTDGPQPPIASWRRWAGYVVVAILASVLIGLSLRSAGRLSEPTVPAPTQQASPSAPVSPLGAELGTTTTAALAQVGTRAAAANALEAWGEFAVTGDLDTMRPWVWEDGPQWENLVADAAGIVGREDTGPRYTVALSNPTFEIIDEAASLRATVTFSRFGELDQTYDWVLELERRGEEWRIWSVTDAE